jgi:hypothetical protein
VATTASQIVDDHVPGQEPQSNVHVDELLEEAEKQSQSGPR